MPYVLDTNVLIDYGREPAVQVRLERCAANGVEFVTAPPALIELTRGLINGGEGRYEQNRRVYRWLLDKEVLELPLPFMACVLRSSYKKRSRVVPGHYTELVRLVAESASLTDFLAASRAPGSVWSDIESAHAIHEGFLDREFGALRKVARRRAAEQIAGKIALMFGAPGCRPKPLLVARRFSAAFEFLEACAEKIRGGANPRVNDAGQYIDSQLLLYLGDPAIQIVTEEDFSHEIRTSPQGDRIVGLQALP